MSELPSLLTDREMCAVDVDGLMEEVDRLNFKVMPILRLLFVSGSVDRVEWREPK